MSDFLKEHENKMKVWIRRIGSDADRRAELWSLIHTCLRQGFDPSDLYEEYRKLDASEQAKAQSMFKGIVNE